MSDIFRSFFILCQEIEEWCEKLQLSSRDGCRDNIFFKNYFRLVFVVNCCLPDKISEAILYRARVSRRFGSENCNTKRGTTAKEEEDKEREEKKELMEVMVVEVVVVVVMAVMIEAAIHKKRTHTRRRTCIRMVRGDIRKW